MRRPLLACGISLAIAPALVQAGGVPTASPNHWRGLEEVVVTGKLDQLNGDPISATVGVVPVLDRKSVV